MVGDAGIEVDRQRRGIRRIGGGGRDAAEIEIEILDLAGQVAAEVGLEAAARRPAKLGLGVRSRNVWNGRWWAHVVYCSTHCEALHELERYDARVKRDGHAFIPRNGIAGTATMAVIEPQMRLRAQPPTKEGS